MNSKKGWIAIGVLTLALIVAVPYAGGQAGSLLKGAPIANAAASGSVDDKHTISVTGEGEIQVGPDVAYISVGVQSDAATANEAQKANAQTFDKLKSVLAKDGIAGPDIKTTNFSVRPQYKYPDNEKPQIVGYTAVHNIEITYRKLDIIGELLDDLSAAGANRVDNIRFDTEKQHDYEIQALNKAMANARAKADALAKSAGGTVKGVLHISENGTPSSPVYANIGFAAEKSMASADTSISTGQITIHSNVTVEYEF